MKKDPTFAKTYKTCEEFGFNKEITAEQCWNTAYQLGRSRWHWGPHWLVSFHGWLNTKISQIKQWFDPTIEPH